MNVSIQLDYRSQLGPIRDQGPRPTCLSFAATAAHEFARSSRMPLSPEYLHYFASVKSRSGGIQFSDVAFALEDSGQPAETKCSYNFTAPPDGWLPPKRIDLYRRKSKSKGPSVDQLANLLDDGDLPVLGIAIPKPFFFPASPWLISSTGPVLGLHAVVVVARGTTGATRCFLVRNSWGTGWGDKGHAWIDDAFVDQHLQRLLVLKDEVT